MCMPENNGWYDLYLYYLCLRNQMSSTFSARTVTFKVLVKALSSCVVLLHKPVDTEFTDKDTHLCLEFILCSSLSLKKKQKKPFLITCTTNCIICPSVLQGEVKHEEEGECCLCCLPASFRSSTLGNHWHNLWGLDLSDVVNCLLWLINRLNVQNWKQMKSHRRYRQKIHRPGFWIMVAIDCLFFNFLIILYRRNDGTISR